MRDKDSIYRDEVNENDETPSFFEMDPTQTIDLQSLFTKDVTLSGSFDLQGDIWTTTFGKLLQALPIPAVLINTNRIIMAANQAWARISKDYEQVLGRPLELILAAPRGMRPVDDVLREVFDARKADSTEAIIQFGKVKKWARLTFRSIRIVEERHVLVLIEDLTAEKKQIIYQREHNRRFKDEIERRKEVEAKLIASRKRYRQVVENANDIIYQADTEGRITYMNHAGERILGYRNEEIIGQNHTVLVPLSHREEAERSRKAQMESRSSHASDEHFIITKDGRTIWVAQNVQLLMESGKVVGFQAIARDVTDRKKAEDALKQSHGELERRVRERTAELAQSNDELIRAVNNRRKAEQSLQHMAHYDSLTDLANRVLFRDRLDQAIKRAFRDRLKVGLLLIDLDRFKDVNDTLGHPLGDKLLQAVAKRLQACVRDSDTVGRLGGDEFTVVVPDLEDTREPSIIAKRILQSVSETYDIDGNEVFVSASMGITFYPSDGADVDRLLQNADTALYKAKSRGKNNYQYFSDEMNQELVERADLETGLRAALESNELRMYYQPIVDFDTGKITGAEMLLRWFRDDGSLVSTEKVVRIAEETGLIFPIGEWVLKTACEQVQEWLRMGITPPPLSLNVSGFQLNRPGFVNQLTKTLDEYGIDGSRFLLELTETAAMRDLERTKTVFREINIYEVGIAIDDFGTGYSSLAYLKELPIRKLKIDKSFVLGIGIDERNRAIISAIVAMAHSLNLKVTAEGVETRDQLGFLWALGCDDWQGYYFNRPLPVDDFTELLRKNTQADTLSFIWSPDKSVHVPAIDSQHKVWLNRVNELSKSVWNGISLKEYGDFVEFLSDYSRLHFGDEEKLMVAHDYPRYLEHKNEHNILKERVYRMKELSFKPEEFTKEALVQVVTELQEWLTDHLGRHDQRLGEFLKDKIQPTSKSR